MQKILRLFLVLTVFSALGLSAQAQCTPDTTTSDVPALYPDTLANGMIGAAYDQAITVVIPQDTTVDFNGNPLEIDICSLILDSIVGLPDGLTFNCNEPSCVWIVNHDSGFVNRGCVQIVGTPTDSVFNDTILVFASVVPGSYDATSDTCEALPIMLPDTLTTIEYQTRFKITMGTSAIEDYSFSQLGINLFPNPSQGKATVEYTLPERTEVQVRLTDIMGREVQNLDLGTQSVGTYQQSIGAANLPKGIYLLSLDLGQGANVQTRKLIIE